MFKMKTGYSQCHSDGVYQFVNATGGDRVLLSNQFGEITCSKFILVSECLAVVAVLRLSRGQGLEQELWKVELVKFRLSDSYEDQSLCIYREPSR